MFTTSNKIAATPVNFDEYDGIENLKAQVKDGKPVVSKLTDDLYNIEKSDIKTGAKGAPKIYGKRK